MGFGASASCDKEDTEKMIPAPQTYADWVNVLTLLKNKSDDAEVLKFSGRFPGGPGWGFRRVKPVLLKYKTRLFTVDLDFRPAEDLQSEKTDQIVQAGLFIS